MERYEPAQIEEKWQRVWAEARAFNVPNPEPGTAKDASKTYVLEMLPYPSGELHMGHVRNYTLGDVVTHFRRRHGFAVLRPMGYDAFGLPAENAAIREGGHPRVVTERNIATIRRQMKRMGWSIDWDRELCDARARVLPLDAVALPALLRARSRLPQGGAGQVVPERPDRARERAGDRRTLRALRRGGRVAEPDPVVLPDHRLRRRAARRDGPARVLAGAGADDAAQLDRPLGGRRGRLPGRRERPRPVGVHDAARHAVRRDVLRARARSTRASSELVAGSEHEAARAGLRPPRRGALGGRACQEKEKNGVFTGRHVVNPVNGERIPIWVADYVLMEYGTGAIMAVPAHDERDFAFAERYGLPVRTVVVPADGESRRPRARSRRTPTTSAWSTRASSPGCRRRRRKQAIVAWLEEQGLGHANDRLPPARLAALAPALLGLPDPDRPLRRPAASSRYRTTSCRWCCPRSRTTCRRAARRSPPRRTGSRSSARRAAARPGARPTRWTRSSTRPGTSCATPTRTTIRRRSSATSSTTGCRSTSTSAASSTRSCT